MRKSLVPESRRTDYSSTRKLIKKNARRVGGWVYFGPLLLRDARKNSGSHQRRLDGQDNLVAISSGAPPAIKLLPWQPWEFWNNEAAERLPLDLIRETRNPAWPFTRSNTTTASMPDPVPLRSASSWLLSSRPGYRHTSTYTPPATRTRQSQTSQVDTVTRLCRWGRRTSEAARNGWHRLSPRNMPCPGVRGGWQGCDSPRPDRNY